MRPLVALAAYDMVIHTNCLSSILRLQAACVERAIAIAIREFSDAHIVRARNEKAAVALADLGTTHLLMVDADIGFEPESVLTMLNFNKEVVGAAYPRRSWDLNQIVGKDIKDRDHAHALLTKFVVKPTARRDGKAEIRDGFLKSDYVGAGCLLVLRNVLTVMAAAMPQLRVQPDKLDTRNKRVVEVRNCGLAPVAAS